MKTTRQSRIVNVLALFFVFIMPALSQPVIPAGEDSGNQTGSRSAVRERTKNPAVNEVPCMIEAEDYSDMSGIVVDPAAYGTTPSGDCISWIEEGDWVEYQVHVEEEDDYFLTIKGTSPCQNASIKVLVDNVEQIQVPVYNSGRWDYYVQYSAEDCLHLTEGNHTVKLQFYDGDPYVTNIDNFIIGERYYIHQEAEDYQDMDGIDVEESADTIFPSQNIGWIEEGDWVEYEIHAFRTGMHALAARHACPNYDSYMKVFVDNQEQFEFEFTWTGFWNSYVGYSNTALTFRLNEGSNTVKFQFFGGSPYVVNINYFEIICVYASDPVGMDLNTLENLCVYPNPTSDIVNIEAPDATSDYTVEIIDVLGKSLITERHTGNNSVNISQLPAGVYYLKIGSGNHFVIKEVLKK